MRKRVTGRSLTEIYFMGLSARMVLACDAVSRLYAIVHPLGVGADGSHLGPILGLLGVDLVVVIALRVTGDWLYLPRLVLVFAGGLVLARCATPAHYIFLLNGIPLSVESGFRSPVLGVPILAAWLVVLPFAPDAASRSIGAGVVSVVFGVIAGWGVRSYGRRRDAAIAAESTLVAAAESSAVELDAQNAVYMANESAADLLQRVGLLIESATGSSARMFVADRKSAISEVTRREAAYIGDVMYAWQRENNEVPDLTKVVSLDIDQRVRLAIVTRRQAHMLAQQLSELTLVGQVLVRFEPGTSLRPEVDRVLQVGVHEITIPRESTGAATVSALPVLTAMIAVWMLVPGLTGEARWIAVLPVALVVLAVASLLTVAVRQGWPLAGRLWFASAALTVVFCLLTRLLPPSEPFLGGIERFPATGAMEYLLLCMFQAMPFMKQRDRATAIAAAASIVVGIAVLDLPHLDVRVYSAEIMIGVSIGMIGAGSGWALLQMADRQRAEARTAVEGDLRELRERTKTRALRELSDVASDTRAQFRAASDQIDPPLRVEIARRLDEIDLQLNHAVNDA